MLRVILNRIQHPVMDLDGRRLVGLFMVLNGLTRMYFPPIVRLHFMSDEIYGAISVVVGCVLIATSLVGWHRHIISRLVALFGASVMVMWAVDLGYRANVFWAMLIFGYVLFREAVRE